jgi:hypothetical protein
MTNFTVENMMAAVLFEPDQESKNALWEAFRKMAFHGFIDIDTFDAFCEAWDQEVLNDGK